MVTVTIKDEPKLWNKGCVMALSKENSDAVRIIEDGEEVSSMWGMDAHYLTEEDIQALNSGKILYFDDGEYAHVLFKGGERG